jgi:hypothetical protein
LWLIREGDIWIALAGRSYGGIIVGFSSWAWYKLECFVLVEWN